MFRSKYLDYAELVAQCQSFARAHPGVVRLGVLGKSRDGRDIPMLTLGRDLDQVRPAVWVDGNMHASEFCGSNAALAIAEDVLRIHAGEESVAGLPAHMAEAIRALHFYIVPRISPDGAEAVLKTGRYVRSHAADNRNDQGRAYWQNADVDGDGQMGYMRQRCADGELVELRDNNGLPLDPPMMVPRKPEDPGPYYRMFPEGHVENFDGHTLPTPHYLADTQTDFNRNFPYQWGAEEQQIGAGAYPGSEPETRAILEFVSAHPNIFAWVNYHTFGGVFLRPLGDKPDHEMDQGDFEIYRQVEHWAKEFTGYPTVSGYHEFQYQPGVPVHGILTDYAYHQRGALAFGVELWDIFTQIGLEKRKKFIENYSTLDRKELNALHRWDQEKNKGRLFKRWRKAQHPQVGEVELDGLDLRVGISNPPYEMLDDVLRAHSATFLRVAALGPRLELSVLKQETLASGATRIEVRIANRGYMGTHGIPSARALPHVEPLRLTSTCEGASLRVLAPGAQVVQLGHLDGWGRGPFGGINIFAPWTRGNGNERVVTFVVEGKGTLKVKVASCRVGTYELGVEVG